jgi:hypothetical protein
LGSRCSAIEIHQHAPPAFRRGADPGTRRSHDKASLSMSPFFSGCPARRAPDRTLPPHVRRGGAGRAIACAGIRHRPLHPGASPWRGARSE